MGTGVKVLSSWFDDTGELVKVSSRSADSGFAVKRQGSTVALPGVEAAVEALSLVSAASVSADESPGGMEEPLLTAGSQLEMRSMDEVIGCMDTVFVILSEASVCPAELLDHVCEAGFWKVASAVPAVE